MTPTLARGLPCLCVLVLILGCGEPMDVRTTQQTYDAAGHLLGDVERPRDLPNLIVLVIDALRHDALPSDGVLHPDDESVRMPFFSSLAAKGVHFTSAVAAAPWTLPSMTSLLTGLLPSEHGQWRVQERWQLPAAVTSFAEVLSAGYGYETGALVNGEWYQLSGRSLLQGFGYRQAAFALQGAEKSVAEWSRRREPERPFFLLLHTFEAHDPYGAANHAWPPQRFEPLNANEPLRPEDVDPAQIFRQAFLSAFRAQQLHWRMGPELSNVLQRYKWRGFAENPDPELAKDLREAYWDGVRWVDGLLARTHGLLESSGLLENTLLVVTSDHGEAFGEHSGLAHSLRLYDELVRVPLVMVGPDVFGGGRIVQEDIGLVDVLPTFLDWAGLEPLDGITGRSAMEVVQGGTWCHPVVSEERLDSVSTGEDVNAVRISARTHRWKYIVTLDLRTGDVREEAYDLLMDPEEVKNLATAAALLPESQAFDACLCEAVERLRARIWERERADEGEVYTTPYGASAPGVNRPRPTPCNKGV